MRRVASLVVLGGSVLALLPATAWAEPPAGGRWTAEWSLPLLLGGALLLFGIGASFASTGLRRLGLALWIAVVALEGFLLVFALQYVSVMAGWLFPALFAGACVFALAAEHARARLSGER